MWQFDPIKIMKQVWSVGWREQALVIATLACSASLILVLIIGADSVLKVALGGVTICLWAVIIIVCLKAGASEDRELYRNALSLVGVNLRSDEEYMQIVLELSNNLDEPIEYKVDIDNSYTIIDGNRQQKTDSGMSATTMVGRKPSYFQLPRFMLPKSFPCNAMVHYEILCGKAQKSVFRQVRDLNVNINYKIKSSQFEIRNWVIV